MKRLKRLAVIGVVILVVLSISACSDGVDGSPQTCEPGLVSTAGDVPASSQDIEVWALFFATYRGLANGEPVFVLEGEEIKIVWRATGEGQVSFRALGPDGSTTTPVWGPVGHAGSTWDTHPGEEWGTGWVFPEAGCWSIEVRRGGAVAYMDVDVRA